MTPLRITRCLLVLAALALPMLRGAHAEVPPSVARLLAEAGLSADALGLVVAPAAGGERFVAHQPDRPLQTGSTMKLVTTLVALEQLGPAWRGRTRLLAAGEIRDGVLHGDLVLQGQADADFGWQALQALLQHARHRGLVEVRGALVLDRSHFNPTRFDLDLPPFDEGPEFAYNAIPDALFANGNLLRVDLFADDQRGLQVVPVTPLAGIRVAHEMVLVDGDCSAWDEGWQPPRVALSHVSSAKVTPPRGARQLEVVLRGTWPLRCDRSIELNVIERNDFTARLVRGLWTGMGGRWRGSVREGKAPPEARLLAERQSRPLSELVRAINKPSDNALTRLLLLALGAASPGDPAEPTLQRAERAVRAWMRQRDIDDAGFVLDNGSGLSRSERASPAQLEGLVRAGLKSRWAPEFLASLPIAGVDGSLRRRLTDSPAAGQARLKTGTLRNVVALAGTMRDAAGQPLVVVAMINHEGKKPREMRPVLDGVIDWVARQRFSAPVPAAAAAAVGG